MTKQEIFDTVARHLATQGRQAVREVTPEDNGLPISTCQYRTPDGLKCAVGAIMPDSIYTPDMEGNSVQTLVMLAQDSADPENPFWDVLESSGDLLKDLQLIHDSSFNWKTEDGIMKALLIVASEHELNASMIPELFSK